MRRRQLTGTIVSGVFLLPLVFLVLGALHDPGAVKPSGLDILVPEPTVAAFARAFDLVAFDRQLLNSAIVVLVAVPLTVLVASWAAFAATRLGPAWRRLIVGASLLALLVPASALWVPRFVLYDELDLIDTRVPLIAPALMATSPFYVLLFFWSFSRLPRDLVDAARLEGLGLPAVWRRVAAPLVRPTTFAVAALAFATHWGNVADPLLYLNDPDLFTAPLGLRQLRDLGPTDFSTQLAAALVITAPAAIAFGAVQHRFLSDVRGTGWTRR